MRRALALLAPLLVVSCAAILGLPDPALDEAAGGSVDASIDAAETDASADGTALDAGSDGPCNTRASFATITRLDSLSTAEAEEQPSLTDDENTIWFFRVDRAQNIYRFVRARRAPDGVFGAATETPFPPVFTSPQVPRISGDGTRIFYSRIVDPARSYEIVSSPVTDAGVETGNVTEYPLINTPVIDFVSSFAGDKTMYLLHVSGGQPGMPTMFNVMYSPFTNNTYEKVFPVPGIATSPVCASGCAYPVVSRDQRTMYLTAAGPTGQADGVYAFRRNTPSDAFVQIGPEPLLKGEVLAAWLSPDECRLYFNKPTPPASDGAAGSSDLYVAEKPK